MAISPLNPYSYGVPNIPDPNDPNDPRNRPGAGLGGYGGYSGSYGGFMPSPQDAAIVVPDGIPATGQGQGPVPMNPYTAQMSQALLQANQPLPTRNLRREGRGALASGLAGGLLGILTGNAAVGLGAAGSAMQGYQSGADERYGQEMGQAMNSQKIAQNEANTYRQMGAQWDTNNNAEARARAAEVGRRVAAYPAYQKSIRESNPNASPEQLGRLAKAYIDQTDELAGGPGRSGLSTQMRRNITTVPTTGELTDGTIAHRDEDGNFGSIDPATGLWRSVPDRIIGKPYLMGARPAVDIQKVDALPTDEGAYPVVDPLTPKEDSPLDTAKAGTAFLASLRTMDAASQQQIIAAADKGGQLGTFGLSIPKRADGTFDISLAQAARPTAATDPAVQKRKEVGTALAFNRKLFADAQTNPEVRKQLGSVIAQQEKFLGIGTGQPLPPDAILPMTPYQKEGNELRRSGQVITQRGQDMAANTADENRAAQNTRSANSLGMQQKGLDYRKEQDAKPRPGSDPTAQYIRGQQSRITRLEGVIDSADKEKNKVLLDKNYSGGNRTQSAIITAQNRRIDEAKKEIQAIKSDVLRRTTPGNPSRPSSPIAKQQPRHAPTGQFRPYPKGNAGKPGSAKPAPKPKTTTFKSKSGTLTITG